MQPLLDSAGAGAMAVICCDPSICVSEEEAMVRPNSDQCAATSFCDLILLQQTIANQSMGMYGSDLKQKR
jgi:hypothetical protein